MAESQNYLNYNNPSDKSDAIKLLKAPTNQKNDIIHEIRSSFRKIHFQFIATLLSLATIFKEKHEIFWTDEYKKLFQNIREKIAKSTENTHFNPNLETRIKWDTSRKGFGAALEHQDAGKLAFSNFFRRTLQLQRIRFLWCGMIY